MGDGLDAFYQRVTQRLPGHYVLVGVHDARGFDSAHGGQMENWLDYGNGDFNPNPRYSKLSKLFASYLFNMSNRREGPALVMNLTKTPTREYPAGTQANSNAPFRLGLTMSLLDDGYFGTHTLKEPDAWWDEYAVDVRRGSSNFGRAVQKGDIDGIHQHRGWLGNPLGPFRRVYIDEDFAPSRSIIGSNTFDQNLNGWAGDERIDLAGDLRDPRRQRCTARVPNAPVQQERNGCVREERTLQRDARRDLHARFFGPLIDHARDPG